VDRVFAVVLVVVRSGCGVFTGGFGAVAFGGVLDGDDPVRRCVGGV
jgi:hypothetical protein